MKLPVSFHQHHWFVLAKAPSWNLSGAFQCFRNISSSLLYIWGVGHTVNWQKNFNKILYWVFSLSYSHWPSFAVLWASILCLVQVISYDAGNSEKSVRSLCWWDKLRRILFVQLVQTSRSFSIWMRQSLQIQPMDRWRKHVGEEQGEHGAGIVSAKACLVCIAQLSFGQLTPVKSIQFIRAICGCQVTNCSWNRVDLGAVLIPTSKVLLVQLTSHMWCERMRRWNMGADDKTGSLGRFMSLCS